MQPLSQCRAIRITYSEPTLVALGIQHARRMYYVILRSVACPAVEYFSRLSHIWHDFRKKKVIEQKICFSIFFTTYMENFSL